MMKKDWGKLQPAVEVAEWISTLNIPVYAANACYFLALSVFPLLLLILASLRYTSLSAVDLIDLVSRILPTALVPAAEKLIVNTYYNSSGAVVSVSALAALWSASRGIHGLLVGLNHIYGVQEDRSAIYTRLISVAYLFVFLLVLILTLVFHVFGQTLAAWIRSKNLPLMDLLDQVIDIGAIVVLVAEVLAFAAIYMVLPNRRNEFLHSLPGAAVAAVGWQVFSNIFSFYVENMVASYSNIYGSVYMVAVSMLWLYFCIVILLFGGVVNRMAQVLFRSPK